MGATELELREGRFVIGRSLNADFRIDSPHVSRQHAAVTVTGDRVMLEDLSSRNGLFVNDVLVRHAVPVEAGDVIRVGDHRISLFRRGAQTGPRPARGGRLQLDAPFDARAEEEPDDDTTRADPLELLGTIVDRAIASGDVREAESLLSGHLNVILSEAKQLGTLKPATSRAAARYAIKLAESTGKGAWLDYVFELYFYAQQLVPLAIVHSLFAATSRARTQDRTTVRRYIDLLRRKRGDLGAEAQLVQQRLERFERL
jgi:predicted component of type VI protein secretion system